MMLSELLQGIATVPADQDRPIGGLAMDSREVSPGDAFVALKITGQHGWDYVADASARGAVAVLWDRHGMDASAGAAPAGLAAIAVDGLGAQVGLIAARFYADPSRSLYVVGVTGTDGKSSVAWMLAQVWHRQHGTAGLMGTLGVGRYGDLQPPTHTTPFPIALQGWLADCRDRGISNAVLEVSSHGLDQRRVDGTRFDCAVLTNLGRDHLDYHGTLEAYADAKARLFAMPGLRCAVVNMDDAFGQRVVAGLPGSVRCIGFGFDAARTADGLRAECVVQNEHGLCFDITGRFGNASISTALIGRFNVANLLAVAGVLLHQGQELPAIAQWLAAVEPVPGRMERVSAARGDSKPLAIVDYAHTPQALRAAIAAVREHGAKRLVCVFGCGGDRDRGKRPLMAQAAAAADAVIVTTDNPRSEDPASIVADIEAGFADGANWSVQPDRREAIRSALAKAGADGAVLIAGKGHEQYQLIGDERLPFSDQAEVRAWFGEGAQ